MTNQVKNTSACRPDVKTHHPAGVTVTAVLAPVRTRAELADEQPAQTEFKENLENQ